MPQPAKGKPRPIAALKVVRRITTAADSARCHRAVAEFCEQRGQIGCSGEAHTIIYSLVPNIVLQLGGTTVSADRSNSFQTFHREPLIRKAGDFVTWCVQSGKAADAAAFSRMVTETLLQHENVDVTTVHFDTTAQSIWVAALFRGAVYHR